MVAEILGSMKLMAPYWGIKEIARVLAKAEEEGELDFDFSVEIKVTDPERREE